MTCTFTLLGKQNVGQQTHDIQGIEPSRDLKSPHRRSLYSHACRPTCIVQLKSGDSRRRCANDEEVMDRFVGFFCMTATPLSLSRFHMFQPTKVAAGRDANFHRLSDSLQSLVSTLLHCLSKRCAVLESVISTGVDSTRS